MYSLVVVLSLAACGSFVLAFLRGRRRHVVLLGIWLVLLLYTHAWGLFLAAGMAGAWVWLWRAGSVAGRDGAYLGAAVGLAYAPWLPTLAFQAVHTAAPWAERPSPFELLAFPGALFGAVAVVPLAVAVLCALRRHPPGDAARLLAAIAVAAAVAAWVCSQLQPAWATRYLAVLLGPLLLALAAVLSRGGRETAVALAAVAALWLAAAPSPAASNVRAEALGAAGALRPSDLVVSTQPEQVPVLYRYLPPNLDYVTPLGPVADPRQVDWRDGLVRLRHGGSLWPVLDRLAPGRRVLFVTPVRDRSGSNWSRLVRARTRQWAAVLTADRRLRVLRPPSAVPPGRVRSGVRVELLQVR